MKILAIDTSCDETSVAVTEGARVLSNVISSQVRQHKKFGGVVPFLAQRLHAERIDAVVEMALARAKVSSSDIGAVAVTYGPGLAPALQVGIATAKGLSSSWGVPLYGINHMAGHVASCYAQVGARASSPSFPLLAVLVSGGHTEIAFARSFGDFQIIGQTLDDALGEAYDKVAKMLGLGYPGGKLVSKLAEEGDYLAYELPVPMIRSGDLNLSYSGLKNAVRLLVKDLSDVAPLSRAVIANVCASFERVAQEALLRKVKLALAAHPEVVQVALAGGVAANARLRREMRAVAREAGVDLVVPANLKLCTDNAAMIGVAAALGIEAGQVPADPEAMDRVPYLSLEDVSFTRAAE